jgi:GMP synthase-like glutamine amidotransferase
MSMKIAILDTVPEPSRHHDEGITDAQKFIDFLAPEMPDSIFQSFFTADNEFPRVLSDFDGFLITGSPCSANDNTSWMQKLEQLVVQVSQMEKPLAGFCFGHQFIARAFGGTVGLNQRGWNIGLFDTHIHSHQSWMESSHAITKLYYFNQERVLELPKGAISFASSAGYPDFGYTLGARIMAIQGHPEQPKRAMLNFLQISENTVGPHVVRETRKSLDSGVPDDRLWAKWVAGFFQHKSP